MQNYRKNNFVADQIARHGEEFGLPLFEEKFKSVSKKTKSRFENAPRSVPTGSGAQRLQRIRQTLNPAQLSETEQIVFDAFAEIGPATNKEVSVYLKNKFNAPNSWDASTVSARNNALREYGRLTRDDKRICRITGEIATTWKII